LLGSLVNVVEEIAVPHANTPQPFAFHQACLEADALRIIIPYLVDLSFMVLRKYT
jgi:hypothetical protein